MDAIATNEIQFDDLCNAWAEAKLFELAGFPRSQGISRSTCVEAILGRFTPKDALEVRIAVDFANYWVPCSDAGMSYQGYADLFLPDAPRYTFEAITHFIGEGLDEEEAEKYTANVRALFKQAYPELF